VIVAIVVDDIVYFKTDEANRGEFAALSLEPFVYMTKQGERTATSYVRAPDEALESPVAMREWLRSALGAALRKAGAKPARRKPYDVDSEEGAESELRNVCKSPCNSAFRIYSEGIELRGT
jgi:DNA transformation protein and related proteins